MRFKRVKMFHDEIVHEMKDQRGQISLSILSDSIILCIIYQ